MFTDPDKNSQSLHLDNKAGRLIMPFIYYASYTPTRLHKNKDRLVCRLLLHIPAWLNRT